MRRADVNSPCTASLPDLGGASRLKVWLLASRPKTLPAAVAPILVGCALAGADGSFHLPAALSALAAALLLQVGTNLANDYSDWHRGVDNAARLGPARATQQGWVSPRAMAVAAALAFAGAAIFGSYLIARGGWPVLVVGLCSIVCGLAYTGGPMPYGYRGLGDLAVFIFFGPVAVGGSYYVQTLRLSSQVLVLSLGVGALVSAILVVNNIRDRQSDRAAGKRTLAVLIGLRSSRIEYAALLGFAQVCPLVAWAVGLGRPSWLISLASLPLALAELRRLWRRDGVQLNTSLASTARLALIYSLLLALGVLL